MAGYLKLKHKIVQKIYILLNLLEINLEIQKCNKLRNWKMVNCQLNLKVLLGTYLQTQNSKNSKIKKPKTG